MSAGLEKRALRNVEARLSEVDSATVKWQRERTRHSAADLQHALALWIAANECLDILTEPEGRR